jgi:hypothetical protein
MVLTKISDVDSQFIAVRACICAGPIQKVSIPRPTSNSNRQSLRASQLFGQIGTAL